MTPLLYSVYFPGSDQYPRLARVLEATARRWAPSWEIRVDAMPAPVLRSSVRQAATDNHAKLGYWADAVDAAPDGRLLLLVDADTFVAAPLEPLERLDFDLAYTVREAVRFPMNGGVVAVKVNARTRSAVRAWYEIDRAFLLDPALCEPFRRVYGGQNQASFGAALEGGTFGELSLLTLPCKEWNAEETAWSSFRPGETRIVHVKAALRAHAFGVDAHPSTRALAEHWRRLERSLPQT